MNNPKVLDQNYWENQYKNKATGWDLGKVSPVIKEYIDTLNNKNCSILIPGCGNSYEAEYLVTQGFTNITIIDIAPTVLEVLCVKFANTTAIKIVQGDFFQHNGQYNLIIEQTFFCALNPNLRSAYVKKMKELLAPNGILVGLLFNRTFESGPPFGGNIEEYQQLFQQDFEIKMIEIAKNSIPARANTELFVEFQKK